MIKIDFFGGLHGNFLELMLNLGFFPSTIDLNHQMFDANGACHVKDFLPDYQPTIKCGHWSWDQIPFAPDDKVVRIRPDHQSMLIAVTNTYLRTAGRSLDIDNLEIDTIAKLERVKHDKKTTPFLETLISEHGVQKDYARSILRNYFYSMFSTPKFGLDVYSVFDPETPSYHEFPFRSFFNTTDFFMELSKIGSYLELPYTPTSALAQLHQEFLRSNQGHHSKTKCDRIIEHILSGQLMPIQCNLVEEAWINHVLTVAFNCVYLEALWQDQYPSNTELIHHAIVEWRTENPNVVLAV